MKHKSVEGGGWSYAATPRGDSWGVAVYNDRVSGVHSWKKGSFATFEDADRRALFLATFGTVCTVCGSEGWTPVETTLIYPAEALTGVARGEDTYGGNTVIVACPACVAETLRTLDAAPFTPRRGTVGWERRPTMEPRYSVYGPAPMTSAVRQQMRSLLTP